MQNLEPKVSIIIPVYNGAEYVSKAIKSVMAQIYSNIELIIINDGSKDDSNSLHIANKHGSSAGKKHRN